MNQNNCEKKLTGYPSIDKPWLKYYSEEAINAPLPECTIYEYLWENNKNHLDDIALVYFGRKITYKKLFACINQTAAAFSALGVKRGDVITIQSLTVPQVVFAIYALSKIGAVANLIYATANAAAVKESLDEKNSHIFVVMESIFEGIKEGLSDANLEAIIVMRVQDEMDAVTKAVYSVGVKAKKLITKGSILPWREFFVTGKDKEGAVQGRGSDPVIMVHTGGTTGKSKTVVLSNYNVNAAALQYVYLGFERRRVMLCALPPFIAFGITVVLHTPLAFGLKSVLCIGADLLEIAGFVQKYRPNYIICGPVQAKNMMETLKGRKLDLSFLHCLSVGGDVLPEKLEEELNEFLVFHNAEIRVAQGYAMSETSAAAVASTRTLGVTVYKKGTVGIPLVYTNVKVVDLDTGAALKYGMVGEICLSGPCTMVEYFKNQEETAHILKVHDDGLIWVHTGDIGSVDEDGFITIEGRIKRMILVSEHGIYHKVFPKVIEDGFMKCGCIKELSVIGKGKKDDSLVNNLIAFVVPEADVPKEYVLARLNEYAAERFETFERPCKYIFIDSLPRTAIGKVNYRALEELEM